MYIGLYVKYPSSLSDFNEALIFSTDFQKNTQISNFMKIRQMGAELFHADRWADGWTAMTCNTRPKIRTLVSAINNKTLFDAS